MWKHFMVVFLGGVGAVVMAIGVQLAIAGSCGGSCNGQQVVCECQGTGCGIDCSAPSPHCDCPCG